mmetsp:Transcript_61351/g.131922  ORF Transcript_61351/g.131922 Transcript_61351/m.131922 type:complete len:227 (+) Transcript_61351:671-1351(+)
MAVKTFSFTGSTSQMAACSYRAPPCNTRRSGMLRKISSRPATSWELCPKQAREVNQAHKAEQERALVLGQRRGQCRMALSRHGSRRRGSASSSPPTGARTFLCIEPASKTACRSRRVHRFSIRWSGTSRRISSRPPHVMAPPRREEEAAKVRSAMPASSWAALGSQSTTFSLRGCPSTPPSTRCRRCLVPMARSLTAKCCLPAASLMSPPSCGWAPSSKRSGWLKT